MNKNHTPPIPTLTASQLSKITTKTDSRHRQLAAAGYFPPPIKGKYETVPTLTGYIRYLRELLERRGSSVNEERELLLRARRKREEFQLSVLQGKHLLADEVTTCIRNLALNQRATLQRCLERELPGKLVALNELEIKERLAAVVDQYLAILHDGAARFLKAPPEA